MMCSVSAIIPTYNDTDRLARAIESVLDQTHEISEIIIVDDCSDDNPEEVIAEYSDDRIRFEAHTTNQGGAAARNTGIEIANSEYIAFLDADDEWKSNKIEIQLTELRSRDDEWVGAYCGVQNDRDAFSNLGDWLAKAIGFRDSNPTREGSTEVIREILRMNLYMSTSSLLIKREMVTAIDGFDERFQRHQDWEFLVRVLKKGKMAYIDEPLVIKHGTGRPSAAVHDDSKVLFLEKFGQEISELESDGEAITHLHKLHLARLYLEDGEFTTGFHILDISTPTDALSVAWSLLIGLRSKVLSTLP